MKYILLLIPLILLSQKVQACECSILLWADWSKPDILESISHNDNIFLASVEKEFGIYYELKVQEVFKGQLRKNDLVLGSFTSSCSGIPKIQREGTWIFYGNFDCNIENVEIFNYSSCGPTRSLLFPPYYSKENNLLFWDLEQEILNQKFNKNILVKFE